MVDVTFGFREVKWAKQRGGRERIKDCWSYQKPCKTTLFKGHLLQMDFLDWYTKWRWRDLKSNIWNGFVILICHTFMVWHEYSKYIDKIYHSTHIHYLHLKRCKLIPIFSKSIPHSFRCEHKYIYYFFCDYPLTFAVIISCGVSICINI